MLQIVACVVLAQTAQSVPNAAISQHDFDPQRQFAGVAEAKHRGPAGVGRKIATDRAASFGGKRQRKHEPRVGRGLLHGHERRASLRGQCCIFGIDATNPVHPRKRDYNGIAPRFRRGTTDLSRVAALGDDAHAGIRTCPHNLRDLVRAAGAHDGLRTAVIAAAPVGEIRGDVGGSGQDLRAADGRVEPRPQGCANVRHERR